MGVYTVFRKSVRFTFRHKKRFLVFLFIFGIISAFVAMFLDQIDTLQTTEFMQQKGVYIEQGSDMSVTYQQGIAFTNLIKSNASSANVQIDSTQMYNYAQLDAFLHVFTINVSRPWYNFELNPSFLKSGRFPKNPNEILIPEGSYQLRNSTPNNVIMRSDLIVGQKLEFSNGTQNMDFTVVGTFDNSQLQIKINKNNEFWLVIDGSKLSNLLSLFGKHLTDAYTYSISFVAPGNILSKTTTKNIQDISNVIRSTIGNNFDTGKYGTFQNQPISVAPDKANQEAGQILSSLAFAVVGGIILSIFFSYLISRFRRREMAVLKTMGYSNSAVRATLFGEIATTAFFGFILGLVAAQGLLYYLSGFNYSALLRLRSILGSFIINVVIILPGIFLVSIRILSVSPAEVFRDR